MKECNVNISDSILNSVKKHLGIFPEDKSFDVDIIMNINAAIFTLNQLGVDTNGFTITSEEDLYENIFSDQSESLVNQIKTYLVYKTRLGFDPPSSSIAVESLKEMIKEIEWRIYAETIPPSDSEERKIKR